MSHRAECAQASIKVSKSDRGWEYQTDEAARRRADARHESHDSQTSSEFNPGEDFIVDALRFDKAKSRRNA